MITASPKEPTRPNFGRVVMKNLPILTKFLIIMAISTVFCLGVAI